MSEPPHLSDQPDFSAAVGALDTSMGALQELLRRLDQQLIAIVRLVRRPEPSAPPKPAGRTWCWVVPVGDALIAHANDGTLWRLSMAEFGEPEWRQLPALPQGGAA